MPDNAIYFQLAYGATTVVLGGYIVSIYWRARAVRARLMAERDAAGR